MSGDPSPTSGAGSTDVGARAQALVAEEVAASTEEVEVQTVEGVVWRDGSLGCPEPGMAYTQALVPGYRVTLAYAGRTYYVHADDRPDGVIVLCEKPQDPYSGDT